WDRLNVERFRRALTLLGEVDVDAVIAERLSGQMPFVSTDLFPAFEDDPPAAAASPSMPAAPVYDYSAIEPEPAEPSPSALTAEAPAAPVAPVSKPQPVR